MPVLHHSTYPGPPFLQFNGHLETMAPMLRRVEIAYERERLELSDGADAIAIRPCAYLSYTFDHRVLDGAGADAFMASVKRRLEGWRAES